MASMPSRPYDALYDPTYTVSGARDHYRQQGQSAGFLVEKVAEHTNLFSELQHYPTSTFRLKSNDKVPAFVDRNFHPHQPSPSQLKHQSQAAQVNGPQQYKYFRRPHLPPGMRATVPLHLAPPNIQTPPQPQPPEPLIKDAATQSDYRESETQTLPWSPDWVLPSDKATLAKQALLSRKYDCQGPEVLQLADLKFGDGLPGGLQEVRRLEKLREKRAFEAALPPIDDVSRLPERQAMIEAWEAAEWAEREEEIKGVQEERLALLHMALQVREEEIEEAHRAQLSQRTSARLSSKAPMFAAIQNNRIKTIRQLASKRKQVDILSKGSTQKKSIIDKYADYGSPVYAPLQREGRFPDVVKPAESPKGPTSNKSERPLLDADALVPASLSGLQELQASLPLGALQPKLHRPKPPAKLNYSQRIAAAVQHDVECISDLLSTAKESQGRGIGQVWPYPVSEAQGISTSCTMASGRFSRTGPGLLQTTSNAASLDCTGTTKSAARMKTGVHETVLTPEAPPLADASGQHAALVLLQRLLRGRAVQSGMYAGKIAKLPLVRELRLALEGTAGCQSRPEARDACTQELDAVIGAAVCRVCCLLASGDEAAVTKLLLSLAAKAEQDKQLQQQTDAKPIHSEPNTVGVAEVAKVEHARKALSELQLQHHHDNEQQPSEHVNSLHAEKFQQPTVSDQEQQQLQQCEQTSQLTPATVQSSHAVEAAPAKATEPQQGEKPGCSEQVGHESVEEDTQEEQKEAAASESSKARISSLSETAPPEAAAVKEASMECTGVEVLEQQAEMCQGGMPMEAAEARAVDQASTYCIVSDVGTSSLGTRQQQQQSDALLEAEHGHVDSSTSVVQPAGRVQDSQVRAQGNSNNCEPSLSGGLAQAAMASGAISSLHSPAECASTLSLGTGIAAETSVGSVQFGAVEAREPSQLEAVAEPSSHPLSVSTSSSSSSSGSTATVTATED